MTHHSKFSASASHRWISCPGSLAAEEGQKGFATLASKEGTVVHKFFSEYMKNLKVDDYSISTKDIIANFDRHNVLAKRIKLGTTYQYLQYSDQKKQESAEKVQIYLSNAMNYVKNTIIQESTGLFWLDCKVYYEDIAPGGFGTLDVMFLKANEKELHIADFKFGKDLVLPENNTQLLLYTSGALQNFLHIPIDYIYLHIIQPRYKLETKDKEENLFENFSYWRITPKELKEKEEWLKSKVLAALDPDAPRIPSEKACKFCKANKKCLERKAWKDAQSEKILQKEQIKVTKYLGTFWLHR